MVSPSEAILSVRQLRVARADGFAVEIPDLSLAPGAAAALLGSSGCGKTTALVGMLGLAPELTTSGAVEVLGAPLPAAGSQAWRDLLFRRVAVILQDARASLDPLTRIGVQLQQATGAADRDLCAALADLGIEQPRQMLRRFPHQVSGGQAQRVCLSIALLRAPALVVADEPTAALDDQRLEDLVRSFALLRERTGTALLLATHDHALLRALDADAYLHQAGSFRRGEAAQAPWPAGSAVGTNGGHALACRDLGVRRADQWIVRDFALELPRGQVVALVGPSGAGKTTVAKVLAGHLAPTTGSVEGSGGGASVQMLFQDAYASLTPGHRVIDLVREVALPDFDVEAEARQLGLSPELLGRTAADLSGGERRRAALLRALAVRPEVLILDEPTASLDRPTAIPVLETLLRARSRDGLTYLLITHDLELARAVADSVVRIDGGRRIEG